MEKNDMHAQLDQLSSLISQLPPGDQTFAESLVSKCRQYGMSSGQRTWVDKLIERASKGTAAIPRVDNFAGVIALFAVAGKSLRYPKIRLRTKDGHVICLGVCGRRSRYEGAINLTDGENFHTGTWWGRIERDGRVTLSAHGEGIRATLTELLARLSREPATTAAEYGKLTGCCTFCNRPLEDAKSTAVGYGPTCAKNFNLPWGAVASRQPSLI